MRNLGALAILAVACSLMLSAIFSVSASEVKIDFTGVADFIVDGDTFNVTAENGTEYRVRLADVNANELGQPGYYEARDYLATLILGKTVCLDVDDLYRWDSHGEGNRLVCVPYVEYNSTHLLNVCEQLFVAGQVEKRNYDNEFSPYSWSLYVPKQEVIPEFPSALMICSILLIPLALAICSKRTHGRMQIKKKV